ncbi:MAG: prolyl oligopeptidase family serine peptidase [Myxococcota bacterium]
MRGWLSLGVLACGGAEDVAPERDVPVWPFEEAESVTPRNWRVGTLADDSNDVVRAAIEQGSLGWPSEGVDADGTTWRGDRAGEFGALGPHPGAFAWAVGRTTFSAGERLFGRASRALDLTVGRVAQPGYFYGDRNRLVPLPVREDESRVAVRGFGGREFEVEVWRTTAELWLNVEDVTPVDFVVGEADAQWIALPVLNLMPVALSGVTARVVDVEGSAFEPMEFEVGTLPGAAVTHVPVQLIPREAPTVEEQELMAMVQVSADGLSFKYERPVTFTARAEADGANRWRTFRSPVDGSVQSWGVRAPAQLDPDEGYARNFWLQGAGVGAAGQSGSYGAKDWAYVVAPTNRHPFGFDWEEWGRANALATLDHAMERFATDPTRVYLTGHSMGGHGTWHVGVTTPGRFATVAPSAGWESFYTYGNTPRPEGAFARARAHSDTRVYLENLARRGIYVIHGDADDNVPVSEGRRMVELSREVTENVEYHEEPGAGHWWDGDPAPGAACVDFPPMMEWIQDWTLDPTELDFSFRSPSPGYSATHSVVTLQSATDGGADVIIDAFRDGDTWSLTTNNARSLTIDGNALMAKGIANLTVDGEPIPLADGPIEVGPESGKRHDVHGPFAQVMRSPFCFVHAEADGPFAQYAGWLTSFWSNLASGSACSVTVDQVDDALRQSHNLIWVGVPESVVEPTVDVGWGDTLRVGSETYEGVMFVVFPANGRLNAAIVGTPGHEYDMFGINPISSRGGLPDVLVYRRDQGTQFSAIFDGDWALP